jgi:hypothetical protein
MVWVFQNRGAALASVIVGGFTSDPTNGRNDVDGTKIVIVIIRQNTPQAGTYQHGSRFALQHLTAVGIALVHLMVGERPYPSSSTAMPRLLDPPPRRAPTMMSFTIDHPTNAPGGKARPGSTPLPAKMCVFYNRAP